MTVPDPRNAPRPEGQPHGGDAPTGQEPASWVPAPTTSSPPPSPAQPETKKGRSRTKPPALQTFGDLLRAVYGGKRKRLNPKKAEIATIRSAPKLDPSEQDALLALSASDRTLERTRELMLLSMRRFDAPALAGQAREFVREVLRRHPAFLLESLGGVLENRPGATSEEGAVRILTSQTYVALPWPEGVTVLKKKEAEQCRVNALCCLLLWFRETRGVPFERIQRYLQANIWVPAAHSHKTDPQRLRVLMVTRDPAGIAVACSALEKQAHEQEQQAVIARTAEARATMRTKELEGMLTSVKTELDVTKAQVDHLTVEIESAKRAHENEKAHMRNNYEELRGRVLRRLREELSLLDDGLLALRRDPPKVHVMEDHAERAIDGLKREMERIKGDD